MRVPASFCGVYGIRPTHGRFDLSGAMEMAPTFDVGGWFAASPGTFRKAGSVLLQGTRRADKIGRVLFARDAFHLCDERVGDALRRFVKRSLPVLPESDDATIAPEGFDAWRVAFRNIQGREDSEPKGVA